MFGIDWSDPQTFWLNLTNTGLGLIVVACVLQMGYALVREVAHRRAQRRASTLGDHAVWVSDLGWTVADGGRTVDKDSTDTDPSSTPL